MHIEATMSPPMRSIGSSASASGSGGVTKFMKSLYRDEFRWSLVKSVGLFALGIAIARDDDDDSLIVLFKIIFKPNNAKLLELTLTL